MNKVLKIKNLSKGYGDKKVVDGVDLEVNEGEVFSMIGPNGSGKTTILKTVVGLLKPDTGEIEVGGVDVVTSPVESKKRIGYVSDRPEAYPFLSGWEFLYLTGQLKGVEKEKVEARAEKLIGGLGMERTMKQKMEGYSRGSWQKVAFLAALLGEPELLVIDEPVAGLDPVSIEIFGETLREETKRGAAVLLVTHTLGFGDDYADRVGLLEEGKLRAVSKIEEEMSLEEWYRQEVTKQ